MPYGTVNLLRGVPAGETPVTCTAGIGTFLVEFGALSRLTGDPIYELTARRAMDALWQRRSVLGLVRVGVLRYHLTAMSISPQYKADPADNLMELLSTALLKIRSN